MVVAALLAGGLQQAAVAAEAEPEPTSDFLVTFAPGISSAESQDLLDSTGAVVTSSVAPLRLYAASLTNSAAQALSESSSVTKVEADRVREVQLAPNDPTYADQWALPTIGWDSARDSVVPGGAAVVAVLDTGVSPTDDLAGNLVAGTSVLPGITGTDDPNGHGTAMASIVAAGVDNGTGIAGVGYQGVSVMPVKVLDADGTGQDSAIVEGVVYAADHGADVILMSFSNPGASSALQAAVDYAWSSGVVLVAATGNDGTTAATYPAGAAKVVGVSATTQDDGLWAGSNSGADTFLGAPGVGVATGSGAVTGTSAAAAIVAGAAALLRANDPAAGPGVVVGRLARNADPAGSTSDTGNGRVNLARALADDSAEPVVPDGVAGDGGPVVGPYVAAACNLASITVGAQSPSPQTPGSPATFTVTATKNPGQGNCTINLSAGFTGGPPTGGSFSFDPASITGSGSPLTSTLTISTSAGAQSGSYGFRVTGSGTDIGGSSRSGTGTLTLLRANHDPVALTDITSTDEDTALVFAANTLTTNDTDADGDALTVTAVGSPTHGTVSLAAGSVTFTPTADFNGAASFTYTVSDGHGGSATGTVNVTVSAVNDSPTADPKTLDVVRNSSGNAVTLSGSDLETAATGLTFAIAEGPSHGTVSGNGADRSYTPAAGYVGDDSFTYTVTDTGDPAGCSGLGCGTALTSSTATVTIHVTAVATTTTVSPATATYGDGDVTLSADVTSQSPVGSGSVTFTVRRADSSVVGSPTTDSSVVDGEASVSYALPPGTPAGSYTIQAEYGGVSLADSSDTDTLTIDPRPITVTADDKSKVYGEADPELTYQVTVGSLVAGDDLSGALVRDAGETVAGGPYAVRRGTLTAGPNYDVTFVPGVLTITRRALTITADDLTKTYGDEVTFAGTEFEADGLVFADEVDSVTLTSAGAGATAAVADSPYAIVASDAVGSGLDNYEIDYVDGSLTVGRRPVTVTAIDKTKVYGDDDPALTFAISTGSIVNDDTFSGALVRDAGESVAGSPYAIRQGTLTLGDNYALTFVNGSLAITRRGLTVTADDLTKLLNAPNPPLTGTVTGVQFDDQVVVTYSTTATQSSPVGSYPITPSVTGTAPAVLDNYDVTLLPGTLSVLFAWDGFLQPINDTAHQVGVNESKFKLGQTIPVKFDLRDANGAVVTQSTAPTFTRSDYLGACDATAALDTVPTVSPDGAAVYSLTGGHYQYNWSTKSVTKAGEYRIYANLADGTHQSVFICLTR